MKQKEIICIKGDIELQHKTLKVNNPHMNDF